MTKTQKMIMNISLLLVGVASIYYLGYYQEHYIDVDLAQKIIFAVVLSDSIVLAYTNAKNLKNAEASKWIWIIFEILGVVGIIYSLAALWLILAFSHGIGF